MRFIPVYTGNIVTIFIFTMLPPVYPCVYREHRISRHDHIFHNGLSLCIQGTSVQPEKQIVLLRFIPVYTGNMRITKRWIRWVTVYPCVYREHLRCFMFLNNFFGLSLCIQGTYLIMI